MGTVHSLARAAVTLFTGLSLISVPSLVSAGPAEIMATEPPGSIQTASILRNYLSGKCLETGFSGTADFNAANQYTCHGGNNQKWTLEPIGGEGYILIKNVHSGKCLEIGFSGTADFNAANQYVCHGQSNQRWLLQSAGGGVTIRNQHSGKCLEIGFSGTADFNAANQYACHGSANQQWLFA